MKIDHAEGRAGVYLIVHRDSERVYVGSSINVKRRAYAHRWALVGKTHCNGYLQRSWNLYGEHAFDFVVVEYVADMDGLRDREQHFMDFHGCIDKFKGFNLSPTARALTHTEETRRKIGEKAKGRKHTPEAIAKLKERAQHRSPEHIEKITAHLRNKSPEHLAKMGAWHRGKVISEAQRAKQSEATRGRKQTPEHIAARFASRLGKPLSEAWVAAVRAAAKLRVGKPLSEEHKRKLSEASRGKKRPPRSAEHLRKMSEATKAQWAARRAAAAGVLA